MTHIPTEHRCGAQQRAAWRGVLDEVARAVGRLLAHVGPDTTDLPPGLADAITAYLRPPEPAGIVADSLARWATDEPGSACVSIDGVTVANQLHATLWRLAVDGLTWTPSQGGEDLLDAWTCLIEVHTALDGRDEPTALIARAYRAVQLHRLGRCRLALSDLTTAYALWIVIAGTGDSLVRRALIDVLAADCNQVTDHHRTAAWLNTTLRAAAPRCVVRPGWAGLPDLPTPLNAHPWRRCDKMCQTSGC